MKTIFEEMDIFFSCMCPGDKALRQACFNGCNRKINVAVLLWERVQQNAPMVPMRTMRATKAPTAIPMITATGNDSAESNQR